MRKGRYLVWNGVDWSRSREEAATFLHLNDVFAWSDMINVDVADLGGSLVRQEFSWRQFRANLAKRF